jgi:hypothetical protein
MPDPRIENDVLGWRASINCEDLETFCGLLAYEISELRGVKHCSLTTARSVPFVAGAGQG